MKDKNKIQIIHKLRYRLMVWLPEQEGRGHSQCGCVSREGGEGALMVGLQVPPVTIFCDPTFDCVSREGGEGHSWLGCLSREGGDTHNSVA